MFCFCSLLAFAFCLVVACGETIIFANIKNLLKYFVSNLNKLMLARRDSAKMPTKEQVLAHHHKHFSPTFATPNYRVSGGAIGVATC